ncbi:ABC transporter permease [Paenibacillus sp. BIHB 4019]|uniref:ABC transporter permease n=1 Tax=Paenibacillus sp. BIHB 4019 TaxID=1870819 RepID=A0A1B2DI35_9BACL|nr:carbohydrate ABC transporter permease [Paenibacillus sp. BIHB 4019]ANY67382.1 ABC transporter permease [Paenibacillus sp. BIHB 4019]
MVAKRVRVSITTLILLIGSFISLFPFYWAIIGGTNESGKIFAKPPVLLPGNHLFENIRNLNDSIGIGRVMFNSLFVTIVYTVLALIVSTMAGYVFAKFNFKGKTLIFGVFLLSMMIPYHAIVIPVFKMMAAWGWLGTYKALILPNIAYPFAIFLMRQNMMAVPNAMMEAGRIDGVSEWGLFTKIILPSSKPALAATAIYLFMYQWNNFLWPLISATSEDMYTMPVALSSMFGLSRIDYGQVMAGVTLATFPIILFFLLLQKYFIQGMLGSSVKE